MESVLKTCVESNQSQNVGHNIFYRNPLLLAIKLNSKLNLSLGKLNPASNNRALGVKCSPNSLLSGNSVFPYPRNENGSHCPRRDKHCFHVYIV